MKPRIVPDDLDFATVFSGFLFCLSDGNDNIVIVVLTKRRADLRIRAQ
jgi:hypothetical protein